MSVSTDYNIELRDKSGYLKAYLTPYVTKVNWEWNRFGGCGRCSIVVSKDYRGVTFEARDDIQIRIKSGATTKLVYRGYIASSAPQLKIGQEISLDVRGYFDLLKKIVAHDAGNTIRFTNRTVGWIADYIADTFIVPKTPISIAGAITAGDFNIDTIDFLGTLEDALRTLAEIQGNVEYGVNENLVFYWTTESDTITHRFFVGNNVSMLERRINWDNLVNKIYLVGGSVAGVKYKNTGQSTDSQSLYWLNEEIINNSSIVTDSVAVRYMGAILQERDSPNYTMRGKIENSDLRLEDTVPIGRVSFYDATYDNTQSGDIIGETADGGSNITIGETADGGSNHIVGAVYSAQIDRISYSPSNTSGRVNIEIQLGDTILQTAAKIKRLELAMASVTQY